MPAPPPRAPTFPSFLDDVQEIDDTDFVDPDIPLKTVVETELPPSVPTPSPVVKMTDAAASSVPAAAERSPLAPAVPVVPLPVAQSKSRIRSVLLWRDPKVTGIIFAACMLFFFLTLVKQLSVLSVVGLLFGTYLFVGLIVVNVNKKIGGKLDAYVTRPPVGTPLFRQESVNRWAETFLEEGNEVGEDIRDILYCDNTSLTLSWIAVAFTIYLAGMYFSLVSVFLVLTLAAFSLPLAYEKNKKQVDDAVAKVSTAASKHIETGRRAATDRAIQLRDVAASKSAPYLEKAPPAAQNLLGKIGLTSVKKRD